MRKIITILIILFFNITIAQAKTEIKVIKIYDGDTIKAKLKKNEFKIRLIGIDCFETTDNYRAYRQAYYNNLTVEEVINKGINSKNYLLSLYKKYENKKITFEFKGIDTYGRTLGILYFNNVNVNKELVKNGGCFTYEYNEKH